MKISTRQVLFFLACVAPVGKIVLLPARLAESAANDLLFPLAMHYLLQTGAVFLVLLLARRGQSFFGLMQRSFGKIAAKILLTLYALFLFFAALLPLLEQKLLVQSVFYDTLPSLVSFSPFFLFAAFIAAKPLSASGQVCDLLAPIAIAGMAGIFILSAGSADLFALSPAFSSGASGIFTAFRDGFGWFSDAALLLPFLGTFEYKKHLALKGALCYLTGGAVVILFTAIFYGIFQETATNQLFAFTATSKFFAGISTLGRIDYLFIFLLSLVMTFYCALPLQTGVECLLQVYGRGRYLPAIFSVAVSAVLLVLSVLLDYHFTEVLKTVGGTLFWLFPLFSVLIPILLLIFGRRRRETS